METGGRSASSKRHSDVHLGREGARGAGVVDRPMEAVRRNVGAAGPTGSGSLIAVSYEARARGVTRMMNTGAARKQCPELITVMACFLCLQV